MSCPGSAVYHWVCTCTYYTYELKSMRPEAVSPTRYKKKCTCDANAMLEELAETCPCLLSQCTRNFESQKQFCFRHDNDTQTLSLYPSPLCSYTRNEGNRCKDKSAFVMTMMRKASPFTFSRSALPQIPNVPAAAAVPIRTPGRL